MAANAIPVASGSLSGILLAAGPAIWREIMSIFHRAPAGLAASGAFVLALFCGAVTHAAAVNNPVMLVNVKTGKCLTIAGGESTANNVDTVQFDCDSHPSRSWMLREVGGGNIYQIRNVRTGARSRDPLANPPCTSTKCLGRLASN
jgi:Ricin-type beta-trefoil lectin domain-like